jgi:hypothetical protein
MSVVIDMYIIYIYIYLCFIFYKKKNWFDVLIPKFSTLCDKVCQLLATGRWFSPVSSTNKTDRHDITEILLKVALNTINQPPFFFNSKDTKSIVTKIIRI